MDESISDRNSMRSFIYYDFTSKYATDEISLKRQKEEMEKQQRKLNDELHMRHKKETIDLWETEK